MNSVSNSKDCLPHIHQTEALHVSATGIRDSRAHVQCNAPSQVLAAFVNVVEHVNRIFSVVHEQRIDKVAAQEVAKELSKSTNSEGYTLDSFSE